MPAFTRTMESGRKTKCLSNLKQIGQAALLYTADNSQLLPPFYNDTGKMMWYKEIRLFLGASKTGLPISAQYPQGRNLDVFYCPSVDRRRGYPHTDYGANTFVFNTDLAAGSQTKMPRIESPSKIVMFSEALGAGIYPDSSWQLVAAAAKPNPDKWFPHRHGETVNLVFCDGHAQGLPRREVVANFTNYFGSKAMWQ
jgi:prepilin-type processing-associated H-X9-DG protein